jgi:TRAP-type uncharacterized transport system fused permease subunit
MILTAMLLVGVGVVINAIATTGVGNTFSLMINSWADGSLMVALVLIALASLVLGMGLPVTASYVVLATLSAPALVDLIAQSYLLDAVVSGEIGAQAKAMLMLVAPERMAEIGLPMAREAAAELLARVPPDLLGSFKEQALSPATLTVILLSAHMIIFWLSQDSGVTPPVCLTAFAAAAIARTPPMATGFVAWKLAKGLYIVPFLFAYTPMLSGSLWYDLEVAFFAFFAIYALAGAIDGYLEAPVGWPMRAVLLGLGVALMWPEERWLHLAGLAVFAGCFALNLRAARALDRGLQAAPGTG